MILTLLSKIYSFFVDRRNRKYDENKIELVKCQVPVFSIGNIIVGGTGKTPFTIFLAKLLIDMGFKPGIVGRGYGRESKGEILVCDGQNILVSPEVAGDEMFMMAQNTMCPTISSESKNQAALSLEKQFDVDCILVDDGFQHRKLHRDLDIVLIDNKTLENKYLLPKGRLREKIHNLQRADILIFTGEKKINKKDLKLYSKSCVSFNVDKGRNASFLLKQTPTDNNSDNHSKMNSNLEFNLNYNKLGEFIDFDDSLVKQCVLASSIANPDNFENDFKKLGKTVLKHFKYKDHYKYKKNDMLRMINYLKNIKQEHLFITEKDSVKFLKYLDIFADNKISLIVIKLGIDISNKEDFKQLFTKYLNR